MTVYHHFYLTNAYFLPGKMSAMMSGCDRAERDPSSRLARPSPRVFLPGAGFHRYRLAPRGAISMCHNVASETANTQSESYNYLTSFKKLLKKMAMDIEEASLTNTDHRQPASRFCFVCGTENPAGLRLPFYNDNRIVWTEFIPPVTYQGWPGVLHGGIIAAVLDETIGRVSFLYDKWVQTGKLELKFRKPTPLGEPLRVQAELVKDSGRVLEMQGTLTLVKTGDLLAEASGLFLRIPEESRATLALQLGDEFDVWEEWLARNRQNFNGQ